MSAATREAWQKAELDRLVLELPHWEARAGVPRRYLQPGWFRAELTPQEVRTWDGRGSMLLAGPPGTGKSVSAWRAMRRVYGRFAQAEQPRRASGRFLSLSDLFSMVFQRDFDSMDYLAKLDVLVIDDVGIAHETAWPLAELDRLVDRRWQSERSTIVTTNLPPTAHDARAAGASELESFERRYLRVFSRITDQDGPGLVMLSGGDLR